MFICFYHEHFLSRHTSLRPSLVRTLSTTFTFPSIPYSFRSLPQANTYFYSLRLPITGHFLPHSLPSIRTHPSILTDLPAFPIDCSHLRPHFLHPLYLRTPNVSLPPSLASIVGPANYSIPTPSFLRRTVPDGFLQRATPNKSIRFKTHRGAGWYSLHNGLHREEAREEGWREGGNVVEMKVRRNGGMGVRRKERGR